MWVGEMSLDSKLLSDPDFSAVVEGAKGDCEAQAKQTPDFTLKQRIVIHCSDRIVQKQGAMLMMAENEDLLMSLMNYQTFYLAAMMRMELPREYVEGGSGLYPAFDIHDGDEKVGNQVESFLEELGYLD